MKTTKKRTKLTLSEVETQMEVLTKEEMNQLKGGFYIIEDPSGIVSQLKSDLSARISYLESVLSSGNNEFYFGISRNHIESTMKEYKEALGEINALEQAAETYHFSYGSTAETYQQGGIVYSTVPHQSQDPGLVGHELKHMYQFYNGEMSNYNIQHEVSAYRRQDIINNGVNYFKNNLERKADDIRRMLDEKGSQLYPNL